MTLRAYKSPLRFAAVRADGTPLWSESRGLSWTADRTVQTLARGATEQFYGAGMQNGRGNTSHRDKTVEVGVDYNWNDGGHPNSVPFYLSSAGYGVYRNTYAPNTYAFTEPVTTSAKERRFDAYYFTGTGGDAAKDVIGQYTRLTGKPFLPPVYGLEIGDADCYLHNANRGERRTLDALKVADGYVENDMPNGWMLVNDGYGCGYENLAEASAGLGERGMKLGLWTEDGIDKLEEQVKAASGSPSSTSPGSARATSSPSTAARTPTPASRPTATPAASPGPPRAGPAPNAAASSGPATSPAPGSTSAGRSRPTRAPPCPDSPTPPVTSTASSAAAPRPTPATCSGRPSCRSR